VKRKRLIIWAISFVLLAFATNVCAENWYRWMAVAIYALGYMTAVYVSECKSGENDGE
jgi:hypothetical protein